MKEDDAEKSQIVACNVTSHRLAPTTQEFSNRHTGD